MATCKKRQISPIKFILLVLRDGIVIHTTEDINVAIKILQTYNSAKDSKNNRKAK